MDICAPSVACIITAHHLKLFLLTSGGFFINIQDDPSAFGSNRSIISARKAVSGGSTPNMAPAPLHSDIQSKTVFGGSDGSTRGEQFPPWYGGVTNSQVSNRDLVLQTEQNAAGHRGNGAPSQDPYCSLTHVITCLCFPSFLSHPTPKWSSVFGFSTRKVGTLQIKCFHYLHPGPVEKSNDP